MGKSMGAQRALGALGGMWEDREREAKQQGEHWGQSLEARRSGHQGTLEQGEPLGDRAWEHEEHQDPWGVLGGMGLGSTGSTEILGVMDWVRMGMGMGWGAEVSFPHPTPSP